MVGVNSSNPINASITAWKSAADGTELASMLVFGSIPILIGAMVYTRTQKLAPSLFAILFTTLPMHAFDLIDKRVAAPIYVIVALGLALAAFMLYKSRNR